MIATPNDGPGWACDAAIETEAWLEAVTDCEVTDRLDLDDSFDGWDDSREVCEAIHFYRCAEEDEPTRFEPVHRDNVYNQENDFADVFTFTVYADPSANEWCYRECFIAVCTHQGGDVRGNYGPVRVFHVDSPAESGFLDWVLGWHVDGADERTNERLSPGYSAHPSTELYDLMGGERGEWRDGSFYHQTGEDEDGEPIYDDRACTPYLIVG